MSADQPESIPITDDEAKLLDLLDSQWPAWHSCSRLAAGLGFRTQRVWPCLLRLRKVGLVESREKVWEAQDLVYEQWRVIVNDAAALVEQEQQVEKHNPFVPSGSP